MDKRVVSDEECRQLMGDFARGGEVTIAAWLHGFAAGFRVGGEHAIACAREVIDAQVARLGSSARLSSADRLLDRVEVEIPEERR